MNRRAFLGTLAGRLLAAPLAAPSRGAAHRAVVRYYNQRGTAEQWIKVGGHTLDAPLLSPVPGQ